MSKRDVADMLLSSWGEWEVRRVVHGSGYPRHAAFTRTVVQSGRKSTVPLGDLNAAAIGEVLSEFKDSNGNAWLVAYCRYVGDPALPPTQRKPMPISACALRAGCAVSTAYAHLRAAKAAVKIGVLALRKNR